jgi:endogenous inhibitor of DNA gyrase (YacG/DUF329 family)
MPMWQPTWHVTHQSVAAASTSIGVKRYLMFVSNSCKLLDLGKIITNSNKIRKIQTIYQNDQKKT